MYLQKYKCNFFTPKGLQLFFYLQLLGQTIMLTLRCFIVIAQQSQCKMSSIKTKKTCPDIINPISQLRAVLIKRAHLYMELICCTHRVTYEQADIYLYGCT